MIVIVMVMLGDGAGSCDVSIFKMRLSPLFEVADALVVFCDSCLVFLLGLPSCAGVDGELARFTIADRDIWANIITTTLL